jgi:adenylate cyclase
MSAGSFKRKLTAIVSADVKGYSRLMGENEAETVKTLTAYRKIMGELIQQHRGRVIDSPGDNILAEFLSVVDAVQCSVAAQNEFKARNAELPENRRMMFRIGVNLGDVIEEENRIYGDGVNIAARLEALADPGGICISKTAFDQIESKLPLGYQFLGEQTVKNIAKPVGAYKVLMEPRVFDRDEGGEVKTGRPDKPFLPLPDKPSIAVLPFVNMSRDPEQEFFSDGITQEIITALSKVPNLFVISHNSTFTYKGKPVKVKQVSQELGVRCVLEGSVQKSGDRVRITAQLIDTLSGHHLWAERYDRDLKDIFALQDEITMKVITALQVELTAGEMVGMIAKGTKNIDAFIKYLQAYELIDSASKEGNAHARKILEEAIALDPEYSRLYMGLAMTHTYAVWYGTTEFPDQSLARAFEFVQKAISLDNSNAAIYTVLAVVYAMKKQYDKAIAECERAVSLDPNSAENIMRSGMVLNWAGRAEEAIPYLQNAIRLNPLPPAIYFIQLANSYRDLGQYEKAIGASKKALQREPNTQFAYIHMAVSYIRLGQEKEARAAAAEILRINPKFSLERYAKMLPFPQPIADLVINDLRKAGLK